MVDGKLIKSLALSVQEIEIDAYEQIGLSFKGILIEEDEMMTKPSNFEVAQSQQQIIRWIAVVLNLHESFAYGFGEVDRILGDLDVIGDQFKISPLKMQVEHDCVAPHSDKFEFKFSISYLIVLLDELD
jgi:hypothetical protein